MKYYDEDRFELSPEEIATYDGKIYDEDRFEVDRSEIAMPTPAEPVAEVGMDPGIRVGGVSISPFANKALDPVETAQTAAEFAYPATAGLAKRGYGPMATVPSAIGETALWATNPGAAVGRRAGAGAVRGVLGAAPSATKIGEAMIGRGGWLGGTLGEMAQFGAQGAVAQGEASGAFIPGALAGGLRVGGALLGNLRKVLPVSPATRTSEEISQEAGGFLREAESGTSIPAEYIGEAATNPKFLPMAEQYAGREGEVGRNLLDKANEFDQQIFNSVSGKMEGVVVPLQSTIEVLKAGKHKPIGGGALSAAQKRANKKIDDRIAMLDKPVDVDATTDVYFGTKAKAPEVAAKDAWSLRKDLDSEIDWDAEGVDSSIGTKTNALFKKAANTLRGELNSAAGISDEMAQWSKQIDAADDVNRLFSGKGRSYDDRLRAAQGVIDRARGQNRDVTFGQIKHFDEVFGTDFANQITWADAGQKFKLKPNVVADRTYTYQEPIGEAVNDVDPGEAIAQPIRTFKDILGVGGRGVVATKSPAGAVERFQWLNSMEGQGPTPYEAMMQPMAQAFNETARKSIVPLSQKRNDGPMNKKKKEEK